MARTEEERLAKNRENFKKWYAVPANREKRREYQRKARAVNPEHHRELRRKYYAANKKHWWKSRGLPTPTRPAPNSCELCLAPPSKKALALDHSHATGKFRGWLCSKCNKALGLFNDNAALLRKAADYLEAA